MRKTYGDRDCEDPAGGFSTPTAGEVLACPSQEPHPVTPALGLIYLRSSGSRYPLFAPHTFQSLPAPIAINVIKRTVNLHLFSGLWIASKMYQTIFLNILLTNNDNLSTNSIIAFYTVCPDPPFSEVKGWKVVTWSTLKYSHFYRRKNSSRRFWKCTAQYTCISGVFVDLGVVHRIAVYPISVD